MLAGSLAQIAHVHGQLAVAIDAATLQPSVLEEAQQTLIFLARKTNRLDLSGVVASGVNDHDLAQPANAVLVWMALYECVLHPDCLAKYAATSFWDVALLGYTLELGLQPPLIVCLGDMHLPITRGHALGLNL